MLQSLDRRKPPLADSGSKDAKVQPDQKSKDGEAAKPAPSAPAPSNPAPTGPAAERLNTALSDAKKAITDSEAARKSGDWTAYGKAQEALTKAVEEAAKAQSELGK